MDAGYLMVLAPEQPQFRMGPLREVGLVCLASPAGFLFPASAFLSLSCKLSPKLLVGEHRSAFSLPCLENSSGVHVTCWRRSEITASSSWTV